MSFERIRRFFAAIALPAVMFSSAQAAPSPTIVPIGVAATLTEMESNSSIFAGDYVRKGIQLALEHYSDRLKTKNLHIRLEYFDYNNSDLDALKAANKAAESDVLVVHGYDFSSHALIAAPVHQAAKLAMVTPTSTADRLSKFGAYIHQISFTNSYQASILAKYVFKTLKVRHPLIVAAADCAYCEDLESTFSTEFTRLSGHTPSRLPILGNSEDYSKVARQAVRLKETDLVFLPNYEMLSAKVITAFLAEGIHVPYLGGDGWTTFGERVFKNILNLRSFEAYSVGHWHSSSQSPVSKRLIQDFQTKFKTAANDTSALSYDAMCVILEAVLRAKSYTREEIEKELSEVGVFRGATGNIPVGSSKSVPRSLYLLHVTPAGFSLVGDLTKESKKP